MRRVGCPLMALAVSWLWPGMTAAQERLDELGWGMHPAWWIMGTWGLLVALLMLLFWALVIAGIALSIRWLLTPGRGVRPDVALDILRERYARGEISKEEFEAKKRDLS